MASRAEMQGNCIPETKSQIRTAATRATLPPVTETAADEDGQSVKWTSTDGVNAQVLNAVHA